MAGSLRSGKPRAAAVVELRRAARHHDRLKPLVAKTKGSEAALTTRTFLAGSLCLGHYRRSLHLARQEVRRAALAGMVGFAGGCDDGLRRFYESVVIGGFWPGLHTSERRAIRVAALGRKAA